VVSQHRINNSHDFNWSTPHVLHVENHTFKQELAEMVFIKKFNNNSNLQKDIENLIIAYT